MMAQEEGSRGMARGPRAKYLSGLLWQAPSCGQSCAGEKLGRVSVGVTVPDDGAGRRISWDSTWTTCSIPFGIIVASSVLRPIMRSRKAWATSALLSQMMAHEEGSSGMARGPRAQYLSGLLWQAPSCGQ